MIYHINLYLPAPRKSAPKPDPANTPQPTESEAKKADAEKPDSSSPIGTKSEAKAEETGNSSQAKNKQMFFGSKQKFVQF